jgi:hypothetical protein
VLESLKERFQHFSLQTGWRLFEKNCRRALNACHVLAVTRRFVSHELHAFLLILDLVTDCTRLLLKGVSQNPIILAVVKDDDEE